MSCVVGNQGLVKPLPLRRAKIRYCNGLSQWSSARFLNSALEVYREVFCLFSDIPKLARVFLPPGSRGDYNTQTQCSKVRYPSVTFFLDILFVSALVIIQQLKRNSIAVSS